MRRDRHIGSRQVALGARGSNVAETKHARATAISMKEAHLPITKNLIATVQPVIGVSPFKGELAADGRTGHERGQVVIMR